jgi:hypothetical protein
MKSLAHYPELVAPLRVHPEPIESGCLVEVYAPCCGRRTFADSILDVRAVPNTIVQGAHQPAQDHDWLCHDCRWRLYVDPANDWTPSRLCSAVGAAADVVREQYAHELAAQAESWMLSGRIEFDEVELRDAIRQALPLGIDPHRSGT